MLPAFSDQKLQETHVEDGDFCPISAATLLHKVSASLQTDGAFSVSREYSKRATRLREIFLGQQHPHTLDSLDSEAFVI